MNRYPSSSRCPTSPVWNQPSGTACAVAVPGRASSRSSSTASGCRSRRRRRPVPAIRRSRRSAARTAGAAAADAARPARTATWTSSRAPPSPNSRIPRRSRRSGRAAPLVEDLGRQRRTAAHQSPRARTGRSTPAAACQQPQHGRHDGADPHAARTARAATSRPARTSASAPSGSARRHAAPSSTPAARTRAPAATAATRRCSRRRRRTRSPTTPPTDSASWLSIDALRASGRPAGVEQRGHLGRVHRGEVGLVARARARRTNGVRRRRADDHAPDVEVGRRDHLGQELRRRHDHRRAGVAQRVAQFVLAEQEQQRGDGRADTPHRLVGDEHLRAVGHAHGDSVAGAHAEVGRAPTAKRRPSAPSAAEVCSVPSKTRVLSSSEAALRRPRPARRARLRTVR